MGPSITPVRLSEHSVKERKPRGGGGAGFEKKNKRRFLERQAVLRRRGIVASESWGLPTKPEIFGRVRLTL